jgi:hypothetical protein
MKRHVVATIVPTTTETKLLVTVGRDEVLKARLGPAAKVHRSAAPMLIEAIARWYEQRVYVVISAAGDVISDDLGLADGLGYGTQTLHYEVEWVDPRDHHRGRRLRGLGDFGEVRRQLRLVWAR